MVVRLSALRLMFNEGRENVHDEAWSGGPALVNEDLVRKVKERVRDDRRFTISDLSMQFPRISRTLWYCQQSFGLSAAAFYEEGIQKRVPRYDKYLKNGGEYVEKSLKYVESDNNKILYEILLDFFYSETVLTFRISLVQSQHYL